MMHPRDEVVVHLGRAARLAVGEDYDVLDLRAAVAERALGFAQRGNQESLAVRGEPVDHLIEISAALPDRLQRDDDERLRIEADDTDQIVVLERFGDGLGGGFGVSEFVTKSLKDNDL